jgi:hypothetical protein
VTEFQNMAYQQYLNQLRMSKHLADEVNLHRGTNLPQLTQIAGPSSSQAANIAPLSLQQHLAQQLQQQQQQAALRVSSKTNSRSSTTNNILSNLNNLKNANPPQRWNDPSVAQIMADPHNTVGSNQYLYHTSQQPRSNMPVLDQAFFAQNHRPGANSLPNNLQAHLNQVNAQTYNNQQRPVGAPRRAPNWNIATTPSLPTTTHPSLPTNPGGQN